MDHNIKAYNKRSIVNWYVDFTELYNVEKVIFDTYKDQLKQGKVLDIGIGAGRTTDYLFQNSRQYVGIDYSNNLYLSAKNKFPNAELHCLDARDLSHFSNEEFDFINFSFNGIDHVNDSDRTKILHEINRVLKTNGTFFFSTHNKSNEDFNKIPWRNKKMGFMYNLKTFLKLSPFIWKKLFNKKLELIEKDHAMIVEHAHHYSLLIFYTSPEYLINQLKKSNFDEIRFFELDGKEISWDKATEPWIFVTCKKIRT